MKNRLDIIVATTVAFVAVTLSVAFVLRRREPVKLAPPSPMPHAEAKIPEPDAGKSQVDLK